MPCGVNRHKGDEGGVPRGGNRREGEGVPCGGNRHTGRGVPHGGNRRQGGGVCLVEATDARGRGCYVSL